MRFLATLFSLIFFISTASVADEQVDPNRNKPILLKGIKAQGSLLVGQVDPDAVVLLNDKPLKVANNGVIVFGFGRDAELNHTLTVVSKNGEKHIEPLTLEKRDYKIQRVNGISKKIMNPSKKNQQRSSAEAALVRKARETDSIRQDFLAGFVQPVKGPVTGVYGSQRVYNGVPKRPHFGVDYAAPVGTPVIAPSSGVVTLVHNDMFYSGGTLIVDHGFGVSSTFIHLSKILVKEGQEIKQGEVIAEVGKSGRATGAHLDWRINWYKLRIDPQLVMEAMPDKVVFQ